MEKDSLTIGGKEIEVLRDSIEHTKLKFYPENPRIYSLINAADDEPSQKDIEEKLSVLDHVKQLIQSIQANGGVLDPLMVRDGDFVVLEGNSRLAAYRCLAKKDPIKWGKIKCCLLPRDISEDLVFALLGEYHIIGRKDWAPYEQAGYLWRRHKHHGIPVEQMAKEMGISAHQVKDYIAVYSFMVEHNDNDVQRWSYYDEYLKSRKIEKRRGENPELDKVFVKKVKSSEIPKAIDVREKLVKICEAGGKPLRFFIESKKTLDKCYTAAVARGVENILYKHLAKFRKEISDPDAKEELQEMPQGLLDKCRYELHKIKNAVDKLLDKLDND